MLRALSIRITFRRQIVIQNEKIMANILPAIADEAREWPLDKLTRYILEHYHKGTVDQVEVIWTMAKQFIGKPGATEMHVIVQLLSESYEDLSNHFHKEEMMLFPYIIALGSAASLCEELQETINQGLEAQPLTFGRACSRSGFEASSDSPRSIAAFHCGSVQYPCRQMMMEHDGELERYDRILGICKTFTVPFASSEECHQLVSCIEVFLQKLKEHIYLENENLFPRAIKAEGLEIMA